MDTGMIAETNTAETMTGTVVEITGAITGMAIQEVLMRGVTLAIMCMTGEILT